MAMKPTKTPFRGVNVTRSGRFGAATREFSAGTWLTAREAAIARDRVVLFMGLDKPLNLPEESRKLGPASAEAMKLASLMATVAKTKSKLRNGFLGVAQLRSGRYQAQPTPDLRAGAWEGVEDAALARDRVILHLGLVRALNFPEKARALGPASASQMRHAASRLSRGPHQFRGTEYRKRDGKWTARFLWRGTRHNLGTFSSAEDAARAYDEAVWNLTGDAALLNFAPPEHPPSGELPPRQRPPRKKSSKFIGVTKTATGTFHAFLIREGTDHNLGTWVTAQDAAVARDRAALYFNREEVKLNFPEYSRSLGPLSPLKLVGQARAANPVSKNGYQGVGYYQHTGSWFAFVTVQGREHKVGSFGSVEEAARARDRLWLHLRREHSLLNFPDEEHKAASLKQLREEVRRAFKESTSSSYRGVSYNAARGHWNAYIRSAGRHMYLGAFEVEIQAARAYDEAAARLHKQPKLNFPDLVKRRPKK